MRKLLLIAFIIFLGASASQRAYAEEKEINDVNDVRVVLFILDGTPRDLLYDQVKSGNLPTLKEYFWDSGTHANAMISTFPSQSASAYQSFITGLFAGRSGIPYLQWYDRALQTDIDYLGMDFLRVSDDMWNYWAIQDPSLDHTKYPLTIMEKLKGYPSASVYSEIRRGAKEQLPAFPVPVLVDAFVLNRQEMLDVRPYRTVKKLFSRKHKEIPLFTLAGLYAADVFQHKDGSSTERAKTSLAQFDIFMREFIALLKERGFFEKTYLIVVADHGMHDVDHDVDLEPILRGAGLKIRSSNPRQKRADVFISERGVASAHLYFKGTDKDFAELIGADKKYRQDLDGRPKLSRLRKYPLSDGRYLDVIDLLRKNEGLSLVIARDGHERVQVYSKDCSATITKVNLDKSVYYSYTPNSCDPLNYCADPKIKGMCGGAMFEEAEWLKATWDKRYPDGVVQLGQLFDDGRAGDIFVTADDKGAFYRQKSATHGSLIDEDMSTPMMMIGPGIGHEEIGPIRTVDLYPTMLSWFGLKDDGNHDGHDIFVKHSDHPIDRSIANMMAYTLDKPSLLRSANPGEMKADFKRKFARDIHTLGLMKAIHEESSLQSAKLKKLEAMSADLHRKDLLFSLANELIEKIKDDSQRLDDVGQMVEAALAPPPDHWSE